MSTPRKRARREAEDGDWSPSAVEEDVLVERAHGSRGTPKKRTSSSGTRIPTRTKKKQSAMKLFSLGGDTSEIEDADTAECSTSNKLNDKNQDGSSEAEEIEWEQTPPKTPRRTAQEIEASRARALERRKARILQNNYGSLNSDSTTTAACDSSQAGPTADASQTLRDVQPSLDRLFDDDHVTPTVEAAGISLNEDAEARRARREATQKRYKEIAQRSLGEYGYIVKEETTTYGLSKRQQAPGEDFQPDPRCTPDQLRVLEMVKQGKNVFFTGSAGVGKSFLLAELRGMLEHQNRQTAVLATTGIASLQVGGSTVHSWAGIHLGDGDVGSLVKMIEEQKEKTQRWQQTQTLIIDEISMLTPKLFSKLSHVGKIVRRDKRPFGGLQLVLCGDFFQLPPILDKDLRCPRCGRSGMRRLPFSQSGMVPENIPGRPENGVYHCVKSVSFDNVTNGCDFKLRARSFVFETAEWAECDFTCVELTKVFRQADAEFISHLEKWRRGIVDPQSLDFLKSCGSAIDSGEAGIKPTNLFPLRSRVTKENGLAYNELKTAEFKFDAIDGSRGPFGAQEKNRRLKDLQAEPQIALKIETQVLLLANIDLDSGLANGSRGCVVDWQDADQYDRSMAGQRTKGEQSDAFKEENIAVWLNNQKKRVYPIVSFACGVTTVIRPHTWKLELDDRNSCWRTQIPLQWGWALTMHKSQGQSLDRVNVQLKGVFEAGQAYVALSRCRTPEGMKVFDIGPGSIHAHPTAIVFYDRIREGVPFMPKPENPLNPLDWLRPGGQLWQSEYSFFRAEPTSNPSSSSSPAKSVSAFGLDASPDNSKPSIKPSVAHLYNAQDLKPRPALPTPAGSWKVQLSRAAEAFAASNEFANPQAFAVEAQRLVNAELAAQGMPILTMPAGPSTSSQQVYGMFTGNNQQEQASTKHKRSKGKGKKRNRTGL